MCVPSEPTTGARWVAGPIVLERPVGERLRIMTISTTPELGRALVLGAELAHELANAIGEGAIADPVAVCMHCGARFVHIGSFWSSDRCERADGSIGLEHYTAGA